MRDILEDLFNEVVDPTESARRNMRPQLRKRFYHRAHVGDAAPFAILLDDRSVRTPGAASSMRSSRSSSIGSAEISST